jgi:DNA-binding response OmpR family regulator
MSRLLVVEDDQQIGTLLESALRANGHTVSWARTGADAIGLVDTESFELVLLDLGLPDVDGVQVCREIRLREPDCVLVMLTARRDEMDVIVGLEAGADDYLTKPFALTELLARIRAHLRRASGGRGHTTTTFVSGDLRIDPGSRRCEVGGKEVHLRAKEFDLLARLADEPGRAVSREDLMADVWDENWFGSTKTLDVHMASLRRRLSEAAAALEEPVLLPAITTLRGHGYRLEAPASQSTS